MRAFLLQGIRPAERQMSEKEELEIKGLIGRIAGKLIAENDCIRAQDLIRAVHETGINTEDTAVQVLCQQAVRMLADYMH